MGMGARSACDQGHLLPDQVEWDVEASWTPEQRDRWAAVNYEGDGPGQFTDQGGLIRVAIQRFRGELARQWWEEDIPPAQPGDRLYLGFVPIDDDDIDEEWGRLEGTPPWGSVLAEIEVVKTSGS